MSQDMRVALTTSLNDQLVGPLRRALDEVERNLAKLQRELGGVTTASTQANQVMANMEGPKKAAKAAADLSRETNEALRLAGRLESAWNRAGNMIRGAAGAAAGVAAARYVLKEPLQNERSYELRLAHMANTAYAGATGRNHQLGMGTIDTSIQQALRYGGGTRDEAAGAAQALLAKDISASQLGKVLPEVMRAATASDSSATDIAVMIAQQLKSGFKPEEIKDAIGKTIRAGQMGSFEIKDIAKWIPKFLAANSTIGMSGMKDYERTLAMAQVATTTAGSSDEAGNNLLNFLLKINSIDTANDAKKNGVDLAGTLAKARGKGIAAPDAFIELIRQTADADPRIVALRKQYASASGNDERIATLNAQKQIFQGTAVGKYLQDRQALMPALALLNNPQEYQRVLAGIAGAGAGTVDATFGNIANTNSFRIQQADNEKLFAQTRALTDVNAGLGKLAGYTAELYQKFPELAEAAEAGKLAVYSLAAAATAASGALFLLGGGKAALAGAGAGAALAGAGALATGAAGVGVAGLAGYGVGTGAYKLGLEGNAGGEAIGTLVNNLLAFFGNRQAQENQQMVGRAEEAARWDAALGKMDQVAQRPIKLFIDGREISAQVDYYTNLNSRRQ
jgi:hypothetical protein